MEVNITKPVKVNAKVLKLHIKCGDDFDCDLLDSDGEVLKVYEGYVPDFFPGQHFGDYLYLDIDIDNGKILNWNQPKAKDIEEFIKGIRE